MHLTPEKKQDIFKKYSSTSNPKDTGSAESQIALFTERINHLTNHLSQNKKDYSTKMGLLKLVGKRRRILDHLQHTNIQKYREIVAKLELRK